MIRECSVNSHGRCLRELISSLCEVAGNQDGRHVTVVLFSSVCGRLLHFPAIPRNVVAVPPSDSYRLPAKPLRTRLPSTGDTDHGYRHHPQRSFCDRATAPPIRRRWATRVRVVEHRHTYSRRPPHVVSLNSHSRDTLSVVSVSSSFSSSAGNLSCCPSARTGMGSRPFPSSPSGGDGGKRWSSSSGCGYAIVSESHALNFKSRLRQSTAWRFWFSCKMISPFIVKDFCLYCTLDQQNK